MTWTAFAVPPAYPVPAPVDEFFEVWEPRLLPLPGDSVLALWVEQNAGDELKLYGRVVTANGTSAPTLGPVSLLWTAATGEQLAMLQMFHAAVDDTGFLVTLWTGSEALGWFNNLFLIRVDTATGVATLVDHYREQRGVDFGSGSTGLDGVGCAVAETGDGSAVFYAPYETQSGGTFTAVFRASVVTVVSDQIVLGGWVTASHATSGGTSSILGEVLAGLWVGDGGGVAFTLDAAAWGRVFTLTGTTLTWGSVLIDLPPWVTSPLEGYVTPVDGTSFVKTWRVGADSYRLVRGTLTGGTIASEPAWWWWNDSDGIGGSSARYLPSVVLPGGSVVSAIDSGYAVVLRRDMFAGDGDPEPAASEPLPRGAAGGWEDFGPTGSQATARDFEARETGFFLSVNDYFYTSESAGRAFSRSFAVIWVPLSLESPILRVYPRSDGRAGGARRVWPPSKASQDDRWLPYGGGYR